MYQLNERPDISKWGINGLRVRDLMEELELSNWDTVDKVIYRKSEFNPELRVYNQPNIITSEADIKVTFLKDNFITINTVKNEDYFNVRYLVKPFMLWIWISVLLISLGGIMSLFNKKKYD